MTSLFPPDEIISRFAKVEVFTTNTMIKMKRHRDKLAALKYLTPQDTLNETGPAYCKNITISIGVKTKDQTESLGQLKLNF